VVENHHQASDPSPDVEKLIPRILSGPPGDVVRPLLKGRFHGDHHCASLNRTPRAERSIISSKLFGISDVCPPSRHREVSGTFRADFIQRAGAERTQFQPCRPRRALTEQSHRSVSFALARLRSGLRSPRRTNPKLWGGSSGAERTQRPPQRGERVAGGTSAARGMEGAS
jgi:hypothetical protein